MTFLCGYTFCEQGHKRMIDKGSGVACSKCEKAFHADCFEEHNAEKHNGKAITKPLKEPYEN